LISKQELEQIEASYQIALSQSEQSNANLLSAEDELSKTRLTAPKYGIVTSITKEEGEMAVGGMFNPGVLMTVADLDRMEVEVDVNENDVVNVEIGDTSEIEIDAYPDTIFYGVVSEIAHTAQSTNMGVQNQVTNFKVKVRMISVPDKIRPGMSSTVNIITETLQGALSIPIQSLTSRPENYTEQTNRKKNENTWKGKNDEESSFKKVNPIDVVFILEDEFEEKKAPTDKKFAIVKPIDVGVSSENHYSVRSGVVLGEMVVTGGYRVLSKELYHGALVSVNDNSLDDSE
jgi:HlyD family secretion protein